MKHAIWDRLLIVLCTLLLLAIAASVLGMVTGLLSVGMVAEWIGLFISDRSVRIVGGAAAVILVILAVLLFWVILPRRKSRYSAFAIQQTEHGTLKISVKALEHLVEKCISQHPELSIVTSSIHSNEETVRVDLRVTLQSDINIPLAISSLQKQIKQYVEACSGVDVEEVRVVVEATMPPVPGTNSPYAIPEMMQPRLPKLLEGSPSASAIEPPWVYEEETATFETPVEEIAAEKMAEGTTEKAEEAARQPEAPDTIPPMPDWVQEDAGRASRGAVDEEAAMRAENEAGPGHEEGGREKDGATFAGRATEEDEVP